MGLFGRKQQSTDKPPIDETSDGIQQFFDGYFAELRTRGREHFEKTLEETANEFKKDLDTTITRVNSELKDHIAEKIDKQIAEHDEVMREGQEQVLQALTRSGQALQEQHEHLSQTLQKSVADQQAMLDVAFEENKAQVVAMRETQAQALQWLTQSAQAMQEQHKQLTEAMQKNVAAQELMLINTFEENMAQIVEHYLLAALGDQYDLKTQLPSIIQQMEANKQAIADDMRL